MSLAELQALIAANDGMKVRRIIERGTTKMVVKVQAGFLDGSRPIWMLEAPLDADVDKVTDQVAEMALHFWVRTMGYRR
jgi:hypothetical protein